MAEMVLVVVQLWSPCDMMLLTDDVVAQQVLARAMAQDTVLSFGPVHASLSEIFKDIVIDEEPQEEAA